MSIELSERRSDEFSLKSNIEDEYADSLIAKDKKLIRKVDFRLLPWICMLYALSLIDRNNIAVARIAGMDKALKMDKNNSYNIALLVFFPGFILFDFLSSFVIRRAGPANFLTSIIVCWGAVTVGMGFVPTWQVLAACRALLGICEGGFFPGCVYLVSCWYKRYEVQTRFAIFYMSSVFLAGFSGIIGYGLMQIHADHIAGWRWIYIIEGAFTIIAGLVAYFFLVDFPQKATFLKDHERERIIERLNEDRGDGDHDGLTLAKVLKHLSDWKVWGFGLIICGTTEAHFALSYFIPVILNDMGFSVAASLLLVTPPYVVAVLISLATSWWADKIRYRTPFIVIHSAVAIFGFAIVASTSLPIGFRLFGTFLATAGAIPNQPAVLAFAQNNVTGTSKRAILSSVQVAFAAIGGIAASTVYRQQDAPNYLPGLLATMAFEAFACLVTMSMAFYFRRKNMEADRDDLILEGFKGFRYTT